MAAGAEVLAQSSLTPMDAVVFLYVHGPYGLISGGSLLLLLGIVSLVFRRNVYTTYSQLQPHPDHGPAYVLLYFVAPIVAIAVGVGLVISGLQRI